MIAFTSRSVIPVAHGSGSLLKMQRNIVDKRAGGGNDHSGNCKSGEKLH
jgi:hypothetical protein